MDLKQMYAWVGGCFKQVNQTIEANPDATAQEKAILNEMKDRLENYILHVGIKMLDYKQQQPTTREIAQREADDMFREDIARSYEPDEDEDPNWYKEGF